MISNFQRTFFVTSICAERKTIFRNEKAAELLIETLFHYLRLDKYVLHDFVVMPDHIHLLLTPHPLFSLEKTMQFVKGGFSHSYGKFINARTEVWQRSFTMHRIEDEADFYKRRTYILQNPLRAGLMQTGEMYPYCSANPKYAAAKAAHTGSA